MESSQAAKLCAIGFLLVLSLSASTSEPEVIGTNRVRRSDDFSLESLKTVVEQHGGCHPDTTGPVDVTAGPVDVTAGQVDVTAGQGHFVGERHAGAANQSGCLVEYSGVHGAHVSGPYSYWSPPDLVFDHAVTNVGNAYNTHTGIFTAPVAGTYAFFLSLMVDNTHSYANLAISKNGAVLGVVYANGHSDSYDQGSSLVSTQLLKGDQVWVHQHAGDTIRGSWYTVFTGYLLQAQ